MMVVVFMAPFREGSCRDGRQANANHTSKAEDGWAQSANSN